jgi:transposase
VKLGQEERMTIQVLAARGQSGRETARLLGVSEGAVRYHLRRRAEGAIDGRCRQPQLAEGWSGAVVQYLEAVGEGPVNLAALHEWLLSEHDYPGSLRSVERYFRRRYPKPRQRARRRVETPPGAQAQADWAVWARLQVGGRSQTGYQFHLRLSHSRFGARVWSPRKDQLAWHAVHNAAFRRLDGVPATVRVDNEKTAVSRGAGVWGELNESYRRYARAVRFHIDVCPPRSPHYKGKVERGIRTDRRWHEVSSRSWSGWDELQSWTDERMHQEAARRVCPATGTTVLHAWEMEKRSLAAVPLLPEPFDVAVTRKVASDCLVAFERRQYSVPFRLLGQRVEVRGCAGRVQVWAEGRVVAEHPRQGPERIVIDPRHYEGEATVHVEPPPPLGRMGRRLAELVALAPEKRPLDLYAALAEVAR